MVAAAALSLVTALAACAPGAPAVVRDVPPRPLASAPVAVEAGAPDAASIATERACETHADCGGLSWSAPDAGDADAGAAARLVGRCVHHACVMAQDLDDPPKVTFEQAKARFADLAQHRYPQPVLSAPWLAGVEAVELWVDRSHLWSEAAPACTPYLFHRDSDRLVAPRPRADDKGATLQLADYAHLVGKTLRVRTFGGELIVLPNALAYVGVRANLVPACVNDRHIWRAACEVHECPRCERIVFTEISTGGRHHWPTINVAVPRVDDPSPLCPPCEPGLAADLPAARAAVAGVQALHVVSSGPVFHRTAAGCEKDLAQRRRQNQP